jgi:hypothetical protein
MGKKVKSQNLPKKIAEHQSMQAGRAVMKKTGRKRKKKIPHFLLFIKETDRKIRMNKAKRNGGKKISSGRLCNGVVVFSCR